MRVAVTGARGRLGSALLRTLDSDAIAWPRAVFDLDDPTRPIAAFADQEPDVVVHAAAWTDVDGCARDPGLALRRNGDATACLAGACAERGVAMILISTNEVFDGLRADGPGYGPGDVPAPGNPYGMSKLAGERAAQEAFRAGAARLAIVRTSWLFGLPGRDFPDKILDAAARAAATGDPLRLVADETANPTAVDDLAAAIRDLVRAGTPAGIHHIVNQGEATRATWAREIMRLAGIADIRSEDVPAATWQRPSRPPLRAVLQPTVLPEGSTPMRSWQVATAAYLPALLGIRAQRAGVPA